jgi:hypothetical protein
MYRHRKSLLAVLLLGPMLAGCGGASFSDFSPDFVSRDAEWFSRSGRLFIKNVSIDAPPLTPDKPVTAADLVSSDGGCPGMAAADSPTNANAASDGTMLATAVGGTVALGHTECDVVRGIGAPNSVNIESNHRGERVAVVNYLQGPRAGIYTFTSGRLTSVERGAEVAPVAAPKAAKPRKKKPAAAPT